MPPCHWWHTISVFRFTPPIPPALSLVLYSSSRSLLPSPFTDGNIHLFGFGRLFSGVVIAEWVLLSFYYIICLIWYGCSIWLQVVRSFYHRIFVPMRRWNRKSNEMPSIWQWHSDFIVMKKNWRRFSWKWWDRESHRMATRCETRDMIMMNWWILIQCKLQFALLFIKKCGRVYLVGYLGIHFNFRKFETQNGNESNSRATRCWEIQIKSLRWESTRNAGTISFQNKRSSYNHCLHDNLKKKIKDYDCPVNTWNSVGHRQQLKLENIPSINAAINA